jgi:hypothetical protein
MTPAKQQTEQDGKDTELILYRLGVVEGAVKDVSTKLDKQDTIKKADLQDFKQFITDRMIEFRQGLQSQIDDLKDGKADKQALSDFKKQIAGYGAVVLALGMALFSYMLTRLK